MLYKSEHHPVVIYTYDWKEQPEWHVITSCLNQLRIKWGDISFEMSEIETGSDEHGVAIHPDSFDPEVVKVYWENASTFFDLD